jgi:hypothetical protein
METIRLLGRIPGLQARIKELEAMEARIAATACMCHCERHEDGTWHRVRRCPRCEILEGHDDD